MNKYNKCNHKQMAKNNIKRRNKTRKSQNTIVLNEGKTLNSKCSSITFVDINSELNTTMNKNKHEEEERTIENEGMSISDTVQDKNADELHTTSDCMSVQEIDNVSVTVCDGSTAEKDIVIIETPYTDNITTTASIRPNTYSIADETFAEDNVLKCDAQISQDDTKVTSLQSATHLSTNSNSSNLHDAGTENMNNEIAYKILTSTPETTAILCRKEPFNPNCIVAKQDALNSHARHLVSSDYVKEVSSGVESGGNKKIVNNIMVNDNLVNANNVYANNLGSEVRGTVHSLSGITNVVNTNDMSDNLTNICNTNVQNTSINPCKQKIVLHNDRMNISARYFNEEVRINKFPGYLFIDIYAIKRYTRSDRVYVKLETDSYTFETDKVESSETIKFNNLLYLRLQKPDTFKLKFILYRENITEFTKSCECEIKIDKEFITRTHNTLIETNIEWTACSSKNILSKIHNFFSYKIPDAMKIQTFFSFVSEEEFKIINIPIPTSLYDLGKWIKVRKYFYCTWFSGFCNVRGNVTKVCTYLWKRRFIRIYGYKIYIFNEQNKSLIGVFNMLNTIYNKDTSANNMNTAYKNVICFQNGTTFMEYMFDSTEKYMTFKNVIDFLL